MPRQRELKISVRPLPLILSIALGLWLGAMAIGLTFWASTLLWPDEQPLADLQPPASAPAPAPAVPDDAQRQMFERYQDTLREQAQQQAADAALDNARNLNDPKCQFWLQQNRTAPTDKSQANVLEFCY